MRRQWRALITGLVVMLLACSANERPGLASGAAGSGAAAGAPPTAAGGSGSSATAVASGGDGRSLAGHGDNPVAGATGASGRNATGGVGAAGAGSGSGVAGGSSGAPAAAPCRDTTTCSSGTSCRLPEIAQGVCRGVHCPSSDAPSCGSNSDCAAPLLCSTPTDRLCQEAFRGCMASCKSDNDCGNNRCQPDGRCLPTNHCSLGVPCPVHFHCAQARAADMLGCVRDTCANDADCGTGYCLFTQCYAQLGTCTPAPQRCLAP
jgi:hypothetical protein